MSEKRTISTNQLYWKPEKQDPFILEHVESTFERVIFMELSDQMVPEKRH